MHFIPHQKEGPKDYDASWKGHVPLAIAGLEAYLSLIDEEDWSLIQLAYYIPDDFELELPGPNAWANDLPPDHLGVYDEALKVGLRSSLSFFVFELLHFYAISLCILIPNSSRHVIGFQVLCLLIEIQPILPLFCIFFTVQIYLYAKSWWYLTAQRDVEPLIEGASFTIKKWKESFLFVSCLSIGD